VSTAGGTPSDWVSGERVFAPPRGTLDVDWLVPAVLELAPGSTPGQARAALESAWMQRRGDGGDRVQPGRPGTEHAGDGSPVSVAAARVLTEALETFGG